MAGCVCSTDASMARPPKLSTGDVAAAMSDLHPDWDLVSGKLHRELKFANFIDAFAFMSAIALHAEKADHHPEWSNVYNRVTIDLVTHDAAGITQLDLELATIIDQLSKI